MPLDEIKQAAHIRLFNIQVLFQGTPIIANCIDKSVMVIIFCCCDQRVSSWTATTANLQLREMGFQVANHSPEVRRKSTGGTSVA
jgi:hypothetical protein